MKADKAAVVELLRQMASVMKARGDRHRMRAYGRAADVIEETDRYEELYARGRLQDLPGIGPAIERKIVAYVERGERPAWLDDPSKLPPLARGSATTRARGAAAPLDELREIPAAFHDPPFDGVPDLHVHTLWSDGTLTIEEVAEMARRMSAKGVGISDHSGSLHIANGLKPAEVREQWKEIERVQERFPDVVLLRGTECDILRDGRLDHPDELLAELDFVVASLHSQLRLPEREQTERVLKALDNPYLTVLGHPTTRVPNLRPRANLDLEKVFRKAARNGVAMEVNGNPGRIDLDAGLAHEALESGCKLSLSSDGHSAWEMLSVAVARAIAAEAGATPDDIVNYDVLGGPWE